MISQISLFFSGLDTTSQYLHIQESIIIFFFSWTELRLGVLLIRRIISAVPFSAVFALLSLNTCLSVWYKKGYDEVGYYILDVIGKQLTQDFSRQ